MTVKIKQYDREIQRLTETAYPETQALVKVYGIGHLTALTFVLTLFSWFHYTLRETRRLGGQTTNRLPAA